MLSTTIEKHGAVLAVRVDGRLDTVNTPVLEEELKPCLDEEIRQVVMDFAGVDYISSSGLRMLLILEQEMESRGGKVQILHANEDIMSIFNMVGFVNVVHVVTD